MFGVRRRLQQQLQQVRPWASGKWGRGWYTWDFEDKKVQEERLNPASVIFPLPPVVISSFDRLFLSREQWAAFLNYQHAASNFNASLDALNRADKKDKKVRMKLITYLHAGAIGNSGSAGLHDAFNRLNSLVAE